MYDTTTNYTISDKRYKDTTTTTISDKRYDTTISDKRYDTTISGKILTKNNTKQCSKYNYVSVISVVKNEQ